MATSVEMQPHEVTAPPKILHDKMRVGCPELNDVRRTGSGGQQQRRLLANISEPDQVQCLPAALLDSSDDENFDDPFDEEELLRRRKLDRVMRQKPPLPANESFLKYGLDQDSIWNAAAAAVGTTTSPPRTPRASSSSIWASRVLPPAPASPPSSPVSEPPSPQPRSFSSVATKAAGAANINQQQSAKVKQKIAKAQQKAIRSKGAAVTPGFAASPRSRSVTMRKQPQDQPPPPRTRQADQSDWSPSPKHKRDPVAPGLQCCETDAEIMRTLPTEMRKEIRDLASKAAACSTNFMEFPVRDAREAIVLTAHYVLLRREKGGSKLASVMGCLGQNKSYKRHMGATQNERLRRLEFATARIHRSPPVTRRMFELGGIADADQASRVKISVAPDLV